MDYHFTEKNNQILLAVSKTLIETLDLIGQRAVAIPFEENKLLKHALLDLCKQIYANTYALNKLLSDFHDERNNLKRIPIALVLRGAVADCLTGIYLITFRSCTESLKNEIDIMSRDYARFLMYFEEEKLSHLQQIERIDPEKEIKRWKVNFKKSQPHLFSDSNEGEWNLKSPKSFRQGSKIKLTNELDGNLTEEKKAKWIKLNDTKSEFDFLYVSFRYFSQYQHYSFANRKMIEALREEYFGMLTLGISSIVTTANLFYSILGGRGNEDNIESNFETIFKLHESFE